MVKAESLTAGLSKRAKAWIEAEARRTGRSPEAIVEILAEEAARTRLFPGIAFRGPADDRRAWLPGSGHDVWEAIEAYKGIGPVRLREERDFPERLLELALAYYEAYPTEIDEAVAANDLSGEDLERLHPELFRRREPSCGCFWRYISRAGCSCHGWRSSDTRCGPPTRSPRSLA